ncbi:MAG: hypothetical protein ABL921_28435, partial [Pirellula sp.]
MKRFIPIPGDLIIVESSEWYALKDGGRLRVCENVGWLEVGEEIYVAPRHQVNTFWGPDYGPPDGFKKIHMSTSGGPFKTVAMKDLEGLELIGEEDDTFWCWQDAPRANGGMDRKVRVALWRVRLLSDEHHRELKRYGLEAHRDVAEADSDPRHAKDLELVRSWSSGSIRLGCDFCSRRDFDYSWQLPTDWKNIHLYLGEWETHRGVCPECQQRLLDEVNPIVKQIIDRDCHVSTPCRDVVRHVISKLKSGYETYRSMSQADRDLLIEQVVRHHLGNLKEYIEVMSGSSRTLGKDRSNLPR